MSYNYLNNLKYRIEHLEKLVNKKYAIKNEAKQVGTLYHVCSLEAYVNYIYPENKLQASGKYDNWLYGSNQYVSFTRDKRFILETNSNQSSVMVQLVIDGDKLSENYKIGPYNDFAFNYYGEFDDSEDNPEYREMEEAVKGPIKNISKYIKEVRFCISARTISDLLDALLMLNEHKDILKNAKYFNFIKSSMHYIKINIENNANINNVINILFNKVVPLALFSSEEWQIEEAIELGAELNKAYTGYGYPIQFYADSYDSAEYLQLLLENDADPNIYDKSEDSPLAIAVRHDNRESVELLLDYGADVNAIDPSTGQSILDYAYNFASDEIVKLLLAAGAE